MPHDLYETKTSIVIPKDLLPRIRALAKTDKRTAQDWMCIAVREKVEAEERRLQKKEKA